MKLCYFISYPSNTLIKFAMKGPNTKFFETPDLPLKLIPATLLYLINAFLDFLSGRILKVCSMYSDFQKIERKNRNEPFSELSIVTILLIKYSNDDPLDSCKMWPQKMKMALRKALVSIFSAQFFENQNTWNTPLVSYLTENPKMHRWDTIVWQELTSVGKQLFLKSRIGSFDEAAFRKYQTRESIW